MTGSDVLVLAPWILFGAGLAAVVFRLFRSGGSSRGAPPPERPPSRPESGGPGKAPRSARSAAAGRGQRGAGS